MSTGSETINFRRVEFFDYLFGNDVGYFCLATQRPAKRETFQEHYFKWPNDKKELFDTIDQFVPGHNVWFCVNILSIPKRVKENVIPQNLVWADLDTCTPDKLEIPPQCVIESSPGRFQAIWRLKDKVDPLQAEDYSRRIAYKYAEQGADKSGWDLTQLLRVPGTFNFKYEGLNEPPQVKIIVTFETLLKTSLFESLEYVYDEQVDNDQIGVPDFDSLPKPEFVIYEYRSKLQETRFGYLYEREPTDNWSDDLWNLENICIEAGMSVEETFSIALNAKCNKYKRDGRPISHLWREVLKADVQHKKIIGLFDQAPELHMPQLLTAKEADVIGNSVIHDYLSWANTATDAVEEYHELSCAMLLSSICASGLHVKVNWGKIIPNLWGLLLGDTTLTRKSTAMDMAIDFLLEIDPEVIVASDGSPEGILTAVSNRPRMTSMYYRDEIAGFFEAIKKRDHLAGIMETFTKLYDVPKRWPKQLAKELIILEEPVFIFFGGGIQDKTFMLINDTYVLNGFIPRFLVVSGYADIEKLQPTSAPQVHDETKREELKALFNHLHNTYTATTEVEAAGQSFEIQKQYEAVLTKDAWNKFNEIEQKMIDTGTKSDLSAMAVPTFVRMSFSCLKLATLFAAARQEPKDGKIEVTKTDVLESAYFIQKWGRHMVHLLRNANQTADETMLNAVFRSIENHPGIIRAAIMRRHHLTAPVADIIERTLEDRMMIQKRKKGRGMQYWPTGR